MNNIFHSYNMYADRTKFSAKKYLEKEKGIKKSTGYWTGYSWIGKMPDGSWQQFSSEEEYLEIFKESK